MSNAYPHVYPLVLRPILLGKVWGGRRLERFHKELPAGVNIGESWELADLPATSETGAGGGAARSVIDNGPMAGRTFNECMRLWGTDLCPQAITHQDYPLLIKFLDAREDLSVQVHPSAAYARSHPDAHLKTECWLVLDALPGAKIYKGVKPGVTRDSFGVHIRDGTVVDDVLAVSAIAGECHNLPSGTVHALGAGVLVAEIQTPSDTTFRLYDWGRAGRQLHIEQALECIEFGPAPEAVRFSSEPGRGGVLATEFFEMRQVNLRGGMEAKLAQHRGCAMITVAGCGVIRSGSGALDTVGLQAGDTVFVPSALADDAVLGAAPGAGLSVVFATIRGEG